jgi:pyridoxal phosphate enzyme (YggS family)
MSIVLQLNRLRGDLPASTRLVAVSKGQPAELIRELYEAGHYIFGESRAQEMVEKHKSLPKDIDWHFIGHLQVNKVKSIAPFVGMVHSVDSVRLLTELDKQAAANKRQIRVLLQIHIAKEEAKTGFSFEEAEQLIVEGLPKRFPNLIFCGFMGLATLTTDNQEVWREFASLNAFYRRMKVHFPGREFKELSMGMSGDFNLAIRSGSTMVRLGTLLFGGRG